MKTESPKIAIIGAGVSGLIAALNLEEHGYSPVIYEKTDRVGGRIKTTIFDGYQLDHGFQVLLDAYPMATKYLDYDSLELQKFLPGAQVFKDGTSVVIGDPLREPNLLFSTLFSGIGNSRDKWKILKLNKSLKNKSIEEIFGQPETSTIEYLNGIGFSKDIINSFLKPFFSGIFLEPNLETSSRMFQFVYKMLGMGQAAIPKAGIETIPIQLKNRLQSTTFKFNTTVKSCRNGELLFSDDTKVFPDYTIIASEAPLIMPNLKTQQIAWHSCDTLYFTSPKKAIKNPMIGLIANDQALINHLFYHTSLQCLQKGDNELLSVTVVKKHDLTEYQLIQKVKEELKQFAGIEVDRYLKNYRIKKAIPITKDLRYAMTPTETRLTDRIFLAGDYLLNGSLNAAMISGETAAKGVMEVISMG
ncbi:FAD-dependent oxidoreductase [Maribacter thermophilus]|uniref:FAD-dependent oxidoreductase n=1 Tax=Maribacter thermophilus TaxID=1197874 RepID=UPI000641126D|nr:FAD-dependent oxidoreductase [Maribacter thermophilus]